MPRPTLSQRNVESLPLHWVWSEIYCVRFKKYIVEQAENSGQAEYVELSVRMFCPTLLSNNPDICSLAVRCLNNADSRPQLFHTKPKIPLLSIQAIDYLICIAPYTALHSWKQANNGVNIEKWTLRAEQLECNSQFYLFLRQSYDTLFLPTWQLVKLQP